MCKENVSNVKSFHGKSDVSMVIWSYLLPLHHQPGHLETFNAMEWNFMSQ